MVFTGERASRTIAVTVLTSHAGWRAKVHSGSAQMLRLQTTCLSGRLGASLIQDTYEKTANHVKRVYEIRKPRASKSMFGIWQNEGRDVSDCS